MSRSWSTPEDIAATVRKRWYDGTLLRARAETRTFDPIEVPIRGPRATQIGDDLAAVQEWVAALKRGSRDHARYELIFGRVGGRSIGRNLIPVRAVISRLSQAEALLGVGAQADCFERMTQQAATVPVAWQWAMAHPLRALEVAGVWQELLAACQWLDEHRGSGRYLRQISAPGVDTKFAERHRKVLAAMLGVSGSAAGFVRELGLAAKPDYVRVRFQGVVSELAVRTDELAMLDISPRSALIVENEITYLSVEIPDNGLVIWGSGFAVDRAGRLPWLVDADVSYWGDLDTHGFVILDRLRAHLPRTRSVLMDAETLLEHSGRWVVEEKPATSLLHRLTDAEVQVYQGLVSDRWGDRVRLEQERIDWAWASSRLITQTGR